MEQILSAPTTRAFARPPAAAGRSAGPLTPRSRDSYEAMSSNVVAWKPESARSVSIEVLRDVVVELIHAVNGVLNEEFESAIGSLQRCAALLHVEACAPEFNAITEIAGPIARGGLAPWQARIVKTHIDMHLDSSLRTKDLARLVRLSSFHFCRVFRVSFGYAPHTYVTRRRIERAQGLALTSQLTLGQISLECGFADQAHFTKTFRRLCGESPREWRRARVTGTSGATLPVAHSGS